MMCVNKSVCVCIFVCVRVSNVCLNALRFFYVFSLSLLPIGRNVRQSTGIQMHFTFYTHSMITSQEQQLPQLPHHMAGNHSKYNRKSTKSYYTYV